MANEHLTVFPAGSKERGRLKLLADIINTFTEKTASVKDIYFDHGQNWMYTTVVVSNGSRTSMSYQLMNPKEQKTIVHGTQSEFFRLARFLITKANTNTCDKFFGPDLEKMLTELISCDHYTVMEELIGEPLSADILEGDIEARIMSALSKLSNEDLSQWKDRYKI